MRTFLLFIPFFYLTQLFSTYIEFVGSDDPEAFNAYVIKEGDENNGYWMIAARARLEKLGFTFVAKDLKNITNPDILLFENIQPHINSANIDRLPGKKITVIHEPPVVIPILHDLEFLSHFTRVVTFRDDFAKLGSRFIQYSFNAKHPMPDILPSFAERGFSCMVLSNKISPEKGENYSERRRLIHYYETNYPSSGLFQLYGAGWEKLHTTCYQGTTPSQLAVMKEHKFVFVFENWLNHSGYISEKIFDAFHAGSIPVYSGAYNIRDYIPDDCFIDFTLFSSYEELHNFLLSIDEPMWNLMQENIRSFLNSKASNRFNPGKLAEAITRAVIEASAL